MKIGRRILRERHIVLALFILALLPRVLNLNAFITWDEPMWTYRSIKFLTALRRMDFGGTFLVGHPGVLTMWSGATGISIQRLLGFPPTLGGQGGDFMWLSGLPTLDPRDTEALRKLAPFLPATKLPMVVLHAACIVGIYVLARQLFDTKVALLAALLLALDPFHLALSRVLHIDALAANFMTLSLLSLLVHLRSLGFLGITVSESPTCWGHGAMNPNKFGAPMCHPQRETTQLRSHFYLLLSGAFAGLAFLSKSYALFLAPFAGLLLAVACLTKRGFRQAIPLLLGSFATWCLVAALIVFLLWPAMWVDPLGTVQGVLDTAFGYAATAQATSRFFVGKIVDDPGPWFYPVVLAFRTTPLTVFGLVIAIPLLFSGQEHVKRVKRENVKRETNKMQRGNLVAILAYACFFTILMAMGAKKFDRYMLPVILALDIVAAWGLVELGKIKVQRSKIKAQIWTWDLGFWILLLLLQSGYILSYHPYYLAYYNPLLGGLPRAVQVLPVGWGEGMDLAARYLNQKEDAADLRVATWGIPGFAPLFEGQTEELTEHNLA
ncbi:MAG: glycosyltransferase family 39 protein, partial [Anaerolineales bacterium]|nr:glycosyltransferase family 39 protein [Anaerolineales bacterium]